MIQGVLLKYMVATLVSYKTHQTLRLFRASELNTNTETVSLTLILILYDGLPLQING